MCNGDDRIVVCSVNKEEVAIVGELGSAGERVRNFKSGLRSDEGQGGFRLICQNYIPAVRGELVIPLREVLSVVEKAYRDVIDGP